MRFNQTHMLKRISLSLAVFVLPILSFAQKVTNVDANQEGKAIAVTYDLNEMADISLYVTQDGGRTKTLIPQAYLAGDSGKKVQPGHENKILWKVLEQYPNQNFQGENMSFIVKGKPSMRFFAMLNAGYSFDSGFNAGLSFGQIGQFGWYGKAMTTFSFPKNSEFESDENGMVDGMLPAYSGKSSTFKAYGIAGLTVRLGAPVFLMAGVGYGARVYDWETTDGRWVKNTPGSYSGLAIDAGVMTKINNIAISFGATLVSGKVDLSLGVGYVF